MTQTIGFVLTTGPHHPGSKMYVTDSRRRKLLQMSHNISHAKIFPTEAAAMRYAQRFSDLYGLRAESTAALATTPTS